MLRYPCMLRVPNAKRGGQNHKWLSHPCLLGGQKEGGNALPPLTSRGSPMPSEGSKSRNGYLTRATWGAKSGRKCYVPHAFSGVPNTKHGGQNQKHLPQPCLVGRPERRRKCYVTPACSGVPNAKHGEQNQKGLSHPCLLGR